MPVTKIPPKSLLGKKRPKAKVNAATVAASANIVRERNEKWRTRDEAKRAKLPGNGSAAAAALTDPNAPLTEAQRAFAKHWAAGESIITAAAKAGYSSPEVGYRLTRMPKILNVYQEEKRLYAEASQITRKKVIDGMLEAIDFAKMTAEPSSMIAGWREIGKICGYYEPITVKHEITHSGKVIFDRLDALSDIELLKLIEQRAMALAQEDDDEGNKG